MRTSLEKVIDCWRRDQVTLLPPATHNEIRDALLQIEQPLFSQDVLRLYVMTSGMEDYTSDGNTYFSLWSLKRIVEENRLAKATKTQRQGGYFWFADFLINSHFYCLKYETPETSSVYLDLLDFAKDAPTILLAPSLEAFFEKYLSRPSDLWLIDE